MVADRTASRIDAHHHVWDLEACAYPWLTPDLGALYRSFSAAELDEQRRAIGVEATVLVQAAESFEDTDHMLGVASANDWVMAVIGWVPLDEPPAAAVALRRLRAHPAFRGVRSLVQLQGDPRWLLRDEVVATLGQLVAHGFVFEVPADPPHLPAVAEIAARLPDLTIVIDHLGNPPIHAGGWEPWGSDLERCAAHPNVHAKISGFAGSAGPAHTAADIRPAIDHAFASFGSERLMLGSDWPVCLLAYDYSTTLGLLDEATSHRSPAERDHIRHAVARRLYEEDVLTMADATIAGIDIFRVEVPFDHDRVTAGVRNFFTAARVDTDAGVTGWSFVDPPIELLDREIRPALVGHDLFDLEGMTRLGLARWGAVEHAIWDAIGKLAGQPVHRLLGGTSTRLRTYLTCVWPGDATQTDASFDEQAAFAVRLRDLGYQGMKIRAWRPDPMDDVRACAAIRAAVGPDFALMVDRTAHYSGTVWDFDTALAVARGLEEQGVAWIEEAFARDDLDSPARLAALVDIDITGGENELGLEPFRRCLEARAFDVLQPDAMMCGGILMMRKIAALAEAWGVRCIPHGQGHLALAGHLQVAAALGVEWQEIVYVVPPLLPDEIWEPATALLEDGELYTFADGMIEVPTKPGLGLAVDHDAMERYRVDRFSGSGFHVPLGKGQLVK